MKKISIDSLLYFKTFFQVPFKKKKSPRHELWAYYPNVLVSTSFYLSNWGDVILSTYFINIFYQQMLNANVYPKPNPKTIPNPEKKV